MRGRVLAAVAAAVAVVAIVLVVGTALGWWNGTPTGGGAPTTPLAAQTALDPNPAFYGDPVTAAVHVQYDPKVVSAVSPETPLPKGVEGALGLDSLDFIELSIALEERFGVVVQEGEAVEAHFGTLGALARYVAASQSRPS